MDTPVETPEAHKTELDEDEAIWTGETLDTARAALTAEPEPAA